MNPTLELWKMPRRERNSIVRKIQWLKKGIADLKDRQKEQERQLEWTKHTLAEQEKELARLGEIYKLVK